MLFRDLPMQSRFLLNCVLSGDQEEPRTPLIKTVESDGEFGGYEVAENRAIHGDIDDDYPVILLKP